MPHQIDIVHTIGVHCDICNHEWDIRIMHRELARAFQRTDILRTPCPECGHTTACGDRWMFTDDGDYDDERR